MTATAAPAWEWRATGTIWRVFHSGAAGAADAEAAARAVEADEARWSRFRPDSELSRLNDAAGRFVEVSEETFAILRECVHWRAETRGLFQPLVGGALAAWGYTGSIDRQRPFAAASPDAEPLAAELELDEQRRAARVPAGAALDLGGIAKGRIAARVAAVLARRCRDGRLLLDAGGDLLAVRGEHVVAVDGAGESLLLAEGRAVATSGDRHRSWVNGDGRHAQHLIDPETGAPAPPATATVVADDPVDADVLAKTLALRPARLESLRLPARVETPGRTSSTGGWRALLVR